MKFKLSASLSLKLNFLLRYYVFVCILPGKAVPEMTYTVSGGTLNPTHSLTLKVAILYRNMPALVVVCVLFLVCWLALVYFI